MCIRDRYSGLTLKDGKYNLEDVMKSMMDAYETRYNYIAVSYTHLDVYKRQRVH